MVEVTTVEPMVGPLSPAWLDALAEVRGYAREAGLTYAEVVAELRQYLPVSVAESGVHPSHPGPAGTADQGGAR